jgi:hypothetical protein
MNVLDTGDAVPHAKNMLAADWNFPCTSPGDILD